MSEQEALEAFFAEWDRQANEYGASLTREQRDCAEEAWHAALAWLRSQAEPVAWITEDGERCVTALTYNGAKKDGGATWSSMRPYSVPLCLATQPAIPDGWKLVPVEPTPEMVEAAATNVDVSTGCVRVIYADMIHAAPEPRK